MNHMIQNEIESLARRRQEIWRTDMGIEELPRISIRLAELYQQKRTDAARSTSGRSREEIAHSARIESELERLIAR